MTATERFLTSPPVFRTVVLSGAAVLLALLAALQDRLEAHLQQSGFYWSESLLFSAVWWLFAPLAAGTFVLLMRTRRPLHAMPVAVIGVSALHLLLFPLIVLTVSALFYETTFSYGRTLRYALQEYALTVPLIYTAVSVSSVIVALKRRAPGTAAVPPPALVVTEGRKRIRLSAGEIQHLSADPPYVRIHGAGRTLLHTATLREMESLLSAAGFVRIHKSSLINPSRVISYVSRLNGDYDVTMADGSVLRVSRHYAAAFKAACAPRDAAASPRLG
ncbi:MAG: LytTR family transcriptional regulator [Bacteroidetes bacterium]|nr:MAG: LytTR family transcriptional regulator [Bacteroidota bacterium]